MNELKIKGSDFGLEESKAADISAQFKPMLDKMVELETEANEVFKLDVDDVGSAQKAKEVRLKYVKVRTGTATIHKEQKAFYRAGGLFVDGWKNAQIFASQGIEKRLLEIEKHAENKRLAEIEKLNEERNAKCLLFVDDESLILPNLGSMPDSIWDNYIVGLEASFNARIEAKKKAKEEAERLELINKLHFERINELGKYQSFSANILDWNLCQFGELSNEEYSEIKAKLIKAKLDYETEQEETRKENERLRKEAQQKEKEAADLKAKQDKIISDQKAAADKKLKEEKAKADKLAADLKAKQDAEDEANRKALAAQLKEKEDARKSALAPEKDKLTSWIDSFNINDIDSSNFSESGKATVNVITQKFEAFKKWAEQQKESIK